MKKKKGYLKENWDLLLFYGLVIASILFMFILLSGCQGWGCLGYLALEIYMILGLCVMNIIFALIRFFKKQKFHWSRWITLIITLAISTILIMLLSGAQI